MDNCPTLFMFSALCCYRHGECGIFFILNERGVLNMKDLTGFVSVDQATADLLDDGFGEG